jgi:predicted RNase H-like HicB family nuclease
MKKLPIIIEKTPEGFSAYSPYVNGVYSIGESFDELKHNIQDSVKDQIEYLEEIGEINKALILRESELVYKIDMQQFFEYFSMINKSKFAEYIGINPSLLRRYSNDAELYVSDERVKQIEKGIHKLAKDLSSISFS